MERMETVTNKEGFPSSVSVSLILTHGRSKRLLLTRHGVQDNESESWGLIAGGVGKGENAWQAAIREAREEANIREENIIFVQGRNKLNPHVALIRGEDKIRLGLVFDVTYSGPKVPLNGWQVEGDSSVDKVKFFTWREILQLLEDRTSIYRAEFNFPQLIRWTLKHYEINEKRMSVINEWLHNNEENIPGLLKDGDTWRYCPPYNDWMTTPGIHGDPQKTNFARERFISGM